MWKECYRLGVESIDKQHQKLFQMTEQLLKAIEEKKEPDTFRQVIYFLKEYVVVHFKDEEAYQASINYAGMAEHIKQHREFTNTVLSFERNLEQSLYDMKVVKELAGMLTAWLIYHVAEEDQKIVGKNQGEKEETKTGSYLDSFEESVQQVLEKMVGLNTFNIRSEKASFKQMEENVIVTVDLTGDSYHSAVLGFSKELAVKLFEAMTFMVTEEVDELVCSALAEISNIICGNMSILLSKKDVNIDIKTPVFSAEKYMAEKEMEGMYITTDLGNMKIAIVYK